MRTPAHVTLVEVGPRDGLQNEKTPIATAIKIDLCKQLIQAGIRRLEVTSFVSPKWVPQLADSANVLAGLKNKSEILKKTVSYSALVPNMKGLEAAIEAGVQEVVVFTAASEAFTQKNINCSIAESIVRFKPLAKLALSHNIHLRGAISCAMGCPYQGEVPLQNSVEVAIRLQEIGVQEFDVADTIGVATARQVYQVFEAIGNKVGLQHLAGHFHDTYGQALANILAALQLGVSTFHSSIAGLGGCPYAKGATGNVATEDVVYFLEGMGIETGLNLDSLVQTGEWISNQIGRPYLSRAGQAHLAKNKREHSN
jgi:hydroxymethylglutaryl-CoA lyase